MTLTVPEYFFKHAPEKIIAAKGLFSVAYANTRPSKRIEVRNTLHAMIFVQVGQKQIVSNDQTFRLEEGSILFLSQGRYLMSELLGASGSYKALLVYFDDRFVERFLQRYTLSAPETSKIESILPVRATPHIRSIGATFAHYLNAPSSFTPHILELKTHEIWLHLIERYDKRFIAFLYGLLHCKSSRILRALEAHCESLQSVEEMARIANVSKSALRQALKETTDLTPKAWLDTKRLERSAHLLRHSDASIRHIAASCGFASPSHFTVRFKARFGCTPEAYRKQNRQNS